jgi:hypothetical protein
MVSAIKGDRCLFVAMIAAAIAISRFVTATSFADDKTERPKILLNRWQEDWSPLADPRIPREPLDDLKYIPLPK